MKTIVKQVDTFEQLVGICKSQGSSFNPSQASSKMESLESLLETAREKTRHVYHHYQAYVRARNQRRDALLAMQKISMRAYHAAVASEMNEGLLQGLKSLHLKLQGRAPGRAAAPADATDPPATSASGRGPIPQFDAVTRIKNFELFIRVLELHREYCPNEADLSINGLKAMLTHVAEKHTELIASTIRFKRAKQECSESVFGAKGIYGVSKIVKVYAKSAFGTHSNASQSITRLTFVSA